MGSETASSGFKYQWEIWWHQNAANFCAAALLGLISSSFSTIISQLAAARIGRDALVDWMTVANIPLRDSALSIEPKTIAVIVGILFHQAADFSWALLFFGFLGRFTARLKPLGAFGDSFSVGVSDSSSSFDENQIKILTEAFEEAIAVAGIVDRTSPEAEAVAQRIILQFEMGERDPKRICRHATAN